MIILHLLISVLLYENKPYGMGGIGKFVRSVKAERYSSLLLLWQTSSSFQGKHTQKKQKCSLWIQSSLWWVIIAASITTNLVLVSYLSPLYKVQSEGRCEETTIHEEKTTAVTEMRVRSDPNTKNSVISLSHGDPLVFEGFWQSVGEEANTKDSVISLSHGDPTVFEGFWQSVGEEATVVIPGWQTLSYFSDVSNVCWFLEPDFNVEVRRLHKLVGNAVSEGRHIIVGTGSSQLFQAAIFALSPPDASEPMSVVSAMPYYSNYPLMTDFLRSRLYHWAGDARTFNGTSYIEVVCAPNNPDGFINKPILSFEGGKAVHDLAYYWPQYTAITEPADHDIMLFTVSKSTGHAGTRIGWAIVKDPNVAKRMTKFMELNSIGVSKDSQLRAANILKVISDGYELQNTKSTTIKFFDYGRRKLADRWRRLRDVIKQNNYFRLLEYPVETCNFTGEEVTAYPPFAWMKCQKEEIDDAENFLRSLKILTRSGKHFGASRKYVRVSMLDRDQTFDLLIERLASLE